MIKLHSKKHEILAYSIFRGVRFVKEAVSKIVIYKLDSFSISFGLRIYYAIKQKI